MDTSAIQDHIFLFTTVFIILSLWIISSWNRRGKRNLRLPPGPTGWPILKNLPLLFQHPGSTNDDYCYSRLAKEFVEVYKLEFGPQLFYVLSNPSHVREVFSHSHIQGRPSGAVYRVVFGPEAKGIILTSGLSWKAVKRLVTKVFRDLGVNKGMFAEKIQDEINRFTAKLDTLAGDPCCDMANLLKTATSNIICGVLFGRQFEYDDIKVEEVRELIGSLSEAVGPSAIAASNELICRLPFRSGKAIRGCLLRLRKFLVREVEHAKNDTGNNFAKSFCLEMEKGNQYFNEGNLFTCCIEMFFAGTETSSATLAFIILYLTCRPDVQRRCQRELSDFTKINGMPTYYDRSKLPFIEATIHEAHRFSIVPIIGVPHVVEKDLKLFGYDFPKGTLVVGNYGSLFMDPNEFREPRSLTLTDSWKTDSSRHTRA